MFLKSNSPRRMAVVAGAATLGVLLAACSASPNGSSKGETDGSTLVAYTGQAGDYQINFNPFSPSRIGGLGTIYEPLFFYNKAEVSEPVPLLGTEQVWNADGTELTVSLRDDVTWSDGEPFTAADVVFTFELLKSTPGINSSGFDGTVEAVDDTQVKFTFDAPVFVKGPDFMATPIVPEHIWKDVNPEQDVIEKPVGTGAYVLGDYKPQAFTYTANPDYWGGVPALENIRYVALSGNQAGADGIAAGTIDWQTGPIPDIQNTNKNFPSYDHFTQWQSQMVLASCSSAEQGCEGPQTDPAVRKAIYYAIDRTQLNNLAFEDTAGEVSPTFALTPSQDTFVSDEVQEKVAPMSADVDASSEILEEAGWVKGEDGIYAKDGERLSLTIEVVTGWTDYITALDVLASQAKAAGIELTAAQSSWNEWTDKRVNGNFELAIDSLWQGPVSDPYYVYNYFFASSSGAKVGEAAGNNYSRFSSPTVDSALEQLATLPLDDAAARQPLFDTIQTEIVDAMPYIPILTGGTTSIWNTADFSGWPSDDDLYAFPAVWSSFDAAEIFKRLEPQG
ncbi:ABC transporter substrate-binding protein [Microbacterium telephonicum]|uniref:Peptide/nickel transport system substrate-binding protein n=1 Tax=Microbacterium telephonicum TaxID=1714841 RepID=A0A498BZX3_9MICO|nr:ABC transporter substrate-binding protein [Microbacterium telephonicum]RLK46450.1 peptide/nickel transport system substrate-binding protein [Microbacterium telephonicum]